MLSITPSPVPPTLTEQLCIRGKKCSYHGVNVLCKSELQRAYSVPARKERNVVKKEKEVIRWNIPLQEVAAHKVSREKQGKQHILNTFIR